MTSDLPDSMYSYLSVHLDFVNPPDGSVMCGVILTDVTEQILGQLWVSHPNFESTEVMTTISAVIASLINAGMSFVPLKVGTEPTPENLKAVADSALDFVRSIIEEAEQGRFHQSIIPAPSFAPTNVYAIEERGDSDD